MPIIHLNYNLLLTLFFSVSIFNAYAEIFSTTNIKSSYFNDSIKNIVLSKNNQEKIYKIQQIDNSQGLSNSSINAIFQDSENLLWIGTWDGLNRYDGKNFKIFRPEPNNENSLSNQVILKIGEDDDGLLWILTMYGINSYDKKKDTFKRYFFNRENKSPLSESEFNMAINPSKKVFCAIKGYGIGFFLNGKFELLPIEDLPSNTVRKMEFNTNGDLIILFDNNELYIIPLKNLPKDTKDPLYSIIAAKDISDFGIIDSGKVVTKPIKGKEETYLANDRLQKFSITEDKKIISKTSYGLLISDKTNNFLLQSQYKEVKPDWLKNLNKYKITSVFEGAESIIWVGTDGDGLFKVYPLEKSFNLVSKEQIPELDGSIVRTFLKLNDSSFWIGTKGKGLFRLPSIANLASREKLTYKNFNESNSKINNAVYALCKGNNQLVFIGTDGEGIQVYDVKNSKLYDWSEIVGSESVSFYKSVYSIYQDSNDFIYVGTNGYGMIRFKIKRQKDKLFVSQSKTFIADALDSAGLSSNIIFSIIKKNEEELWIGTRLGGLNKFNKKTETFKIYKNEDQNSNSLSSNDILCLLSFEKNKLWIGTSYGLNLMENVDQDFPSITRFDVTNGLPNNTIHGILADKQDNLWISTNFGLSNFITEESRFINYTKSEGLQNNEFSDGAFYKDEDSGMLFMGGIKGFNYFFASRIGESKILPDVLIDKISGQNQDTPYYQNLVISPKSKTHPSIELKHNQNFFDVELAPLTYINNDKSKFAYLLENFDDDWKNMDGRRNISFTNVPSGSYSLWIKWSNRDGIWSDPVKAIDIHISPIFWRSNLAIFLYIIFSLLLFFLIISYYKKRQSLQQNILIRKKEEEIHQNKLNFFTNIAHELQTPLTLIVGPAEKLSELNTLKQQDQKFLRMIKRNSSRLLFLTQQLLDFRKAEYDYLKVTVIKFDLVNLIEQIAELFDEWAIEKNIKYKLDLPTELIGWYDKDKIEKIVFNLLSNAFKYTPKNGVIELSFSQFEQSSKLRISISNTGKGISKEKLDHLFEKFFISEEGEETTTDLFRTGIGLAYIKRLVVVLHGEIFVTNKLNDFTNFEVQIPCSKVAYKEEELNKEKEAVFISDHLKNILEKATENPEQKTNKLGQLANFESEKKLILIVEDEKEIQTLLKEILQDKYKILAAFNGIEALKIIKKKNPDLIISDVMMPEMDGVELCDKVKNNMSTSHIPFIILTAKDSILNRIEGLEKGANSYIPKPFHPNHLLTRIQKLLEEKERILNYFTKDKLSEDINSWPISMDDKSFFKNVIKLIRENIENEDLNSAFIEKELGISSSQLYRKTTEVFGFSTGDLIRTTRLQFAAELLRKSSLSISEICFKSGFNNRSYFYREFKKTYEITPKNYQLQNKLDIQLEHK